MTFKVDNRFEDHFDELQQVFLYITDSCNLSCIQCLYKPNLTDVNSGKDIPLGTAKKLLNYFYKLGARKLTLLGGEPTLYGQSKTGTELGELIDTANSIGYEYIRMDTNGSFSPNILDQSEVSELSEIAFSLDGYTEQMNDSIRGEGVFKNSLKNIKLAVEKGYKVTITATLHEHMLEEGDSGKLKIENMIRFAESLGIDTINFHDIFKVGVPMDTWTGNINPSVEEWPDVYKLIRARIDNDCYDIQVRLPIAFVTEEEFEKNSEFYGYCPAKMGERVMVHPNGLIRICSNMICTPKGVARYNESEISWIEGSLNELQEHELNENTPCTNRNERDYDGLVPVCFSLKPKQNENVWQNLKWDDKMKSDRSYKYMNYSPESAE
ncbi:MAG: radical SAM protein [Halobacteriaceae archaeon]